MNDETKKCLEALQNIRKILPAEIAKKFESDTDGMIYAEKLLHFDFFSGKILGTLWTLKDLKILDCNDKIADAINQVNGLGFFGELSELHEPTAADKVNEMWREGNKLISKSLKYAEIFRDFEDYPMWMLKMLNQKYGFEFEMRNGKIFRVIEKAANVGKR